MTEILTCAQMRAVEMAAIDSGAVSGLALMERAGRGVVEAILATWPELATGPRFAVVLCGPGNNGGDGYVIARRLSDRGWKVELLALGDPSGLPADARRNFAIWSDMGAVQPLTEETSGLGMRPDIVVDALFGTGLTRPVDPSVSRAISRCLTRSQGAAARLISVDCPSGMDCDSGEVLGAQGGIEPVAQLSPDLTVTFHRAKIGHVLGDLRGRFCIVDIGLEGALCDSVRMIGAPSNGDATRWLDKANSGHKFSHGHALVLTGGAGRTGAARLAARAALRIGAGLVTLGAPPSAQFEVAAQITALMLTRLADPADLAEILTDKRITALCLGPGLGLERARKMVPAALGRNGEDARPAVLDADALSAYHEDPHTLFAQLHSTCVLTPHMGEFARLFPDLAMKLAAPATHGPAFSRIDAVRAAAARAGCTVLLKGPVTVIATQQGHCRLHAATGARGAPWLATAGAADVLGGMICGLMARGTPPLEATSLAVWLHVEAARAIGPGLIAEDLPDALPSVLASVLADLDQARASVLC